ncbi:MAG: metal-dependent hydrolase [Pantoea sp. Brub]|nr:metal-dependent hydrolase [Pantoea sp. Brub]
MTVNGHIFFAIAISIFAKKIGINLIIMQADWWHLIPATILTCLLPDIDHPKSFIGKRMRWISQPISKVYGHRGFTHSLLALIFLWIIQNNFIKYFILPNDVMHGMMLGYLSHIIADMLTPAGVPLFWPYSKRFCLPILKINKNNYTERILCFSLIIYVIFFPVCLPYFNIQYWFNKFFHSIQHLILK